MYYKLRNPCPDLSKVLSLQYSNEIAGIKCVPLLTLKDIDLNEFERYKYLGFRPINEWTVSTFVDRPGLYVLNNVLETPTQLKYLERCLFEYPEPPNVTNLSFQGVYNGSNVWHKMGSQKLRWATLGNHYNWNLKEYEEQGRFALPNELKDLANVISKLLGLKEIIADAAIVNYYLEKSNLSPHVDRSERDHSRPLISVSFGQSCVYLTGGRSLDDPIEAIYINSGDILVMDGDQRLVYHGIPRIVKSREFTEDERQLAGVDKSILEYANSNRVNITIRQVD